MEDPVEHRSQENFRESLRHLGFRIINHPRLFLGYQNRSSRLRRPAGAGRVHED